MPLRIANWRKHFENNKSRERDACRYVCMPNKQDGVGLTRILNERDGAAIFGIWCLILQACSRQGTHRDGWLTEDGTPNGRPWDIEDLALRWRRPLEEVQRCLLFVCDRKIGWMEQVQQKCPPSARPVPSVDTERAHGVDDDASDVSGANKNISPADEYKSPASGQLMAEVPAECPPGAPEGKGIERKEGEEKRAGAQAPAAFLHGDEPSQESEASPYEATKALVVAWGAKVEYRDDSGETVDLVPEWMNAFKGLEPFQIEDIFERAKNPTGLPSTFMIERKAWQARQPNGEDAQREIDRLNQREADAKAAIDARAERDRKAGSIAQNEARAALIGTALLAIIDGDPNILLTARALDAVKHIRNGLAGRLPISMRLLAFKTEMPDLYHRAARESGGMAAAS